MLAVDFINVDGTTFTRDVSGEELRILVELRPLINFEGTDYKFTSFTFNPDENRFTVYMDEVVED
ncbi:hypothetical protein QNH38_08075 [Paenibacillus polymyxa]|uniref:hypothetical protein n=1 Tax=Paenibacillus polymyxa TaxID=1406 RepID=UPI0024BFDF09|nr:hypothetical protein [Paenibacillus polymyxa]WHX37388.1 hypothetical protein QNH38_08075 [Paenibacillus polymyxa]